MRRLLLALLLWALPTAACSQTVANTTNTACVTGSTCAVTLSATPTTNNGLVGFAMCYDSGGGATSNFWNFSGGGVTTWQNQATSAINTNNALRFGYGRVDTTPSTSVTLTNNGGNTCEGFSEILEISGLKVTTATSLFDKSDATGAAASAASCGALTPAASGETFVIGAAAVNNNGLSAAMTFSGGSLTYTKYGNDGTSSTVAGYGGVYNSVSAITGADASTGVNNIVICALLVPNAVAAAPPDMSQVIGLRPLKWRTPNWFENYLRNEGWE